MRMNNPFKGMGVALVTPFSTDGSVDFSALGRLIDNHLKVQTDFLCVLGTTAETPCLSIEERTAVTTFVIERVGGRIPILLGCGGNCTAEVVKFLQTAQLDGIDGVLIVAPYYNKPSQEGLYQHFCAVANATELPVVLYNVPGRTGVNIDATTTLRIAEQCMNVVAIKEASGNISQIEKVLMSAPKEFEVLSGDDGITFELLTLGAVGVISVVGNAYPASFRAMVHATLNADYTAALDLHKRFVPLYRLMTIDGNPAGVKALLFEQGKIDDVLRLPLVPARKTTHAELADIVEKGYLTE